MEKVPELRLWGSLSLSKCSWDAEGGGGKTGAESAALATWV